MTRLQSGVKNEAFISLPDYRMTEKLPNAGFDSVTGLVERAGLRLNRTDLCRLCRALRALGALIPFKKGTVFPLKYTFRIENFDKLSNFRLATGGVGACRGRYPS